MFDLTAIEKDAITELLNIGVGRAAASLGQLLGEELMLSVPTLYIQTRRQTAELMHRQDITNVSAIKERFEGGFNGDAMLIFPSHKSLVLVRALLGETVDENSITELEREALLEVGNIILNGCLGSIANTLGGEFFCSLPEYLQGQSIDVLEVEEKADELVLFLHINFAVANLEIEGYLVFLLDIQAADMLRERIHQFLSDSGIS
ncbi:MAG: hypothetical protein ABW166_00795 [Sedimenticola sp.]